MSSFKRSGSIRSKKNKTKAKSKKEVVISTTRGVENDIVSNACKGMLGAVGKGKKDLNELLISTWIDENDLSLQMFDILEIKPASKVK